MKKKAGNGWGRVAEALASLGLSWGLLALALWLILAQTWLYPYLSKDRDNSYGLDEATMQENYRGLISYNLHPGKEELSFRYLPMSSHGRQHFAEVKTLFHTIFLSGLLATALAVILGIYSGRRGNYRFLVDSFRLNLLILLLLAILLLFFFQPVFVAFHHLLFNNDYWLFDPATDPIILYLPASFFQYMAILILALWLGLSAVLRFLLYPRLRLREDRV